MTAKYANLIVDVHHQKVDQVFTYRVPEALADRIRPGMMASAPFGKGDRKIKGYVLELNESCPIPDERLKELSGLLSEEELFSAVDVALARFIKERTGAALSACLALFVPKKPETGLEVRTLLTLCEGVSAGRLGSRQQQVLDFLREHGGSCDLGLMRGELSLGRKVLLSLEKKGLITIDEEPEENPPASFICTDEKADFPLNQEQQAAFSAIAEAADVPRFERFLLFGVTGSGKTEVYLWASREVIRAGRQVILLVPEISLTPQYLKLLSARFGERVGVLHSRLSDAERSRRWLRARAGFYDILVGPRSALFAPLPAPGLVIIDEEHESSYKADEMPAYHVRDVAEEYCRLHKIPLVLGSATPSVESYYRAQQGELRLLTMKKRATGAPLPRVTLVDMRAEAAAGNMGLFSDELRRALRDRLARKEQSILFLNRKGYASFVNCRACGFVLRCPKCYLPYTYHKDKNVLICHHCGKSVRMPEKCPSCGSPYIRAFGVGTQKVEEEAKRLFPEARVARMDLNTAASEGGLEALYRDMACGRTDILIGTQMVAKGFDFPGVTLVGVVAADMTLFSPDYHASERCFQLLTQACGRSGRAQEADSPGEAVIQSFAPEHYSLKAAACEDYEGFYREEIIARDLLSAPPFMHVLQLGVSGPDEDTVRREAAELYELMARYASSRGFELLGPAPASLGRINNIFRWKILAKYADLKRLSAYGRYCLEEYRKRKPQSVISFDLDPAQIW